LQSSPVTEAQRERERGFWESLTERALHSKTERGSSWSEKADPWKTVPASHVGSFDYPMTNPSAPSPSLHIVKSAIISHQALHTTPSLNPINLNSNIYTKMVTYTT
jgi:hypothetical protein